MSVTHKLCLSGAMLLLSVGAMAGKRSFDNSTFNHGSGCGGTGTCFYDQSTAPKGWSTTDTNNIVELWQNGSYDGVDYNDSKRGGQIAEIMAYSSGLLYQLIDINQGETISWTFDHTSRKSANAATLCNTPSAERGGPEKAELVISSADGTKVQILDTAISNSKGVWKTYTGSTKVNLPTGTYRVGLKSTLPTAGSCGNLVDNFQIELKQAGGCTVYPSSSTSASIGRRYTKNPTFNHGSGCGGTGTCFYDQNTASKEWLTTDSNNIVELWQNGSYDGVSYSDSRYGGQIAELLAYSPGLLYQNMNLVNGETINWSFDHTSRKSANAATLCNTPSAERGGSEKAELVIVSADGAKVQVLETAVSDSKGVWRNYSGSTTVSLPTGNYRVGLRSILPTGGSCGNLVDNVNISARSIERHLENPTFNHGSGCGGTGTCFYDQDTASKGWSTTDSNNIVELWQNGSYDGVNYNDSRRGGQIAEIMAYSSGLLYQDVNLVNGETINWSFDHTARKSANAATLCNTPASERGGAEKAELVIISADGTQVQVLDTALSNSKGVWQTYTGSATVNLPTGNYRVGLRSVLPTSGSCGNLVDNVEITLQEKRICDGTNLNVLRRRVN
jgi:hypothetical protein